MKHQAAALVLALALVGCLTACGGGSTNTNDAGSAARGRMNTGTDMYTRGRYYANSRGDVHGNTGKNNTMGNMMDDAANDMRRAGNAVGDTVDRMTGQ